MGCLFSKSLTVIDQKDVTTIEYNEHSDEEYMEDGTNRTLKESIDKIVSIDT